jgi:hypothetical protein
MRRERFSGTPTTHQREEFTQMSKHFGVFRGVVENCSDPLVMGRLQVRVPAIHGILLKGKVAEDNQYIPSFALPWAQVVTFGGTGYDSGHQIYIPCGSMVAVMFEVGDTTKPFVLGSIHFNPAVPNIKLFHSPDDGWPSYPTPVGLGASFTAAPTVPSESALSFIHTPTRGVLMKSLKGHTLWYDDRDDAECFEMLDRSGEGIRLESYVPISDNKKNKSSRKIYSAFTQSKSPVKSRSSKVMLRESSCDNEMVLETFSEHEKSSLKSGNMKVEVQGTIGRLVAGDVVADQVIDIDTKTGTIRLKADRILLDGSLYVTGKTFFVNNTELYRLVYSHLRAILNEVNIDDPNDLTQTGD